MLTELFEKELIISIKMDLALNYQQKLICHKTQAFDHMRNKPLQIAITQWREKLYKCSFKGFWLLIIIMIIIMMMMMNQRTRKLMTMQKALYPRDDVDRLYVWRKEGERRLDIIENSFDVSIQRLEDYIHKHGGRLNTATRNNTDYMRTKGTEVTRKQKWKEKQLYGRFKQLTSDITHEKTWTWLRNGNLKRETESLLISAQNNAKRTNYIKARIDKT